MVCFDVEDFIERYLITYRMGCPPAFPGLEPLPARKSFSTALTGGRVGLPWWWGFPPGIVAKKMEWSKKKIEMEMTKKSTAGGAGDLVS